MAVFFLVVAGLNLALGFALGAFLAQNFGDQFQRATPETSPECEYPPRAESPAVAMPAAVAAVVERAVPASEVQPSPTLSDSAAPTLPEPKPTAEPKPAAVTASIAEFKAELSRYRDQLSSLDKRMRAGAERQDAVAIKDCLTTLRSANDQYLEQQTDASGRFQSRCNTPELEPINRQLGAALDQQAARVKSSNENLKAVDPEDDLLKSCQQLLEETSSLVDANHAMRDTLDDVELQLGRQGDLAAHAGDPLHNLLSRGQLEATMNGWWQRDPDRRLSLSVGLVDLDRFRDLNEAHGLNVGDRVLEAVAQLVGSVVHDEQRAVRMSAQKFLLMLPTVPVRDATNTLERIRQQVEATRFECNTGSIAVTVSCSVAESTADDTLTTLLERVEATLLEAKRYGRNRTFLHDGKFPAPVVPPVLPAVARTLTV